MAAFPSTLPDPKLNGYKIKPIDQTIRTDMEFGNARVRRRTSTRNDVVSVIWIFTDGELDTFRDWFDDSTTGISGGASWFDIDLKLVNNGITASEARFVGPFEAMLSSENLWEIKAELETR